MKFVFCPVCGHKLLEGDVGSRVRAKCSKCKQVLEVSITETLVNLLPVSGKQPPSKLFKESL